MKKPSAKKTADIRELLQDMGDSLENAKNAVYDLEHSLAMGGELDAADHRLIKIVRAFVWKWREVACDEVERLRSEAKR